MHHTRNTYIYPEACHPLVKAIIVVECMFWSTLRDKGWKKRTPLYDALRRKKKLRVLYAYASICRGMFAFLFMTTQVYIASNIWSKRSWHGFVTFVYTYCIIRGSRTNIHWNWWRYVRLGCCELSWPGVVHSSNASNFVGGNWQEHLIGC